MYIYIYIYIYNYIYIHLHVFQTLYSSFQIRLDCPLLNIHSLVSGLKSGSSVTKSLSFSISYISTIINNYSLVCLHLYQVVVTQNCY